ncbi:MAG: MBL fold metallo-hydrolase [Muribaculaceae bacterium]|nr:MBL fold metallo-hydrolase [Muribaculaceae bacterium]MBQ3961167.1 MBL fold metallo-hydrolase [Muribaculaceae bacterium]MBQ4008961.1 MBL fold metallo-hydrolase [Muribaculaceae bacterium]MBQ5467225.1 MBL fold metallo-hydrolase [Muribaculaceae bacterium]
MDVSRFELNPFGENTYILWHKTAKKAIVVDPGMMRDDERDLIVDFLDRHELTLQAVILTHIHIDHVTGAKWLADKYGVKILANKGDELLASSLPLQAQLFGLKIDVPSFNIDQALKDGDELMLGDEKIVVIATPGHSPGGICLYMPDSATVISGDTLFEGSIGRTDLPGGNFDRLISSIKTKLLTLPDDTVVAPGHGYTTTIGAEKQNNPFLA